MSDSKLFISMIVLLLSLIGGLALMGYGYNTAGLPFTLIGAAGLTLILFYIQWLR